MIHIKFPFNLPIKLCIMIQKNMEGIKKILAVDALSDSWRTTLTKRLKGQATDTSEITRKIKTDFVILLSLYLPPILLLQHYLKNCWTSSLLVLGFLALLRPWKFGHFCGGNCKLFQTASIWFVKCGVKAGQILVDDYKKKLPEPEKTDSSSWLLKESFSFSYHWYTRLIMEQKR